MRPKHAKAIVSQVQSIVSFADPLDLGEPDHLGGAPHDYDDVAARAAAVLIRGGSAWKAVSVIQQVFDSDWGASMSVLTRWQLSRRLHKYAYDHMCGQRSRDAIRIRTRVPSNQLRREHKART